MKLKVWGGEFVGIGGGVGGGAAGSSVRAYAFFPPPLYPPMDLAYFDKPIAGAPPEMRIGYAAITWGDKERQALEDISSLGYRGIQFRANAIKDFQPAELRDLLQQHQLTMVALSSGDVHVERTLEAQDIALHTANAKF